MGDRAPNTHLGRLVREAAWSYSEFAREVNRLATERGTRRTYSSATTWTWVNKGVVPRQASSRSLVVEVLARQLGRPLTLADVGFPQPEDISHERTGTDVVSDLIELGRIYVDSSRRRVVGVGLASMALTIPGWSDVVGRAHAIQVNPHARIGQADVDSVSATIDRLNELGGAMGGQYSRPMASVFLSNTVAPYLRADAPERIRKAMLSAAAMASYFTGWMAMDEGAHGLAQRYYVKGLELAGAADDRMAYCHILRGVGVQAATLGHGPTAARYASAASETAPSRGPYLIAFMAGAEAHGYAMAGSGQSALDRLRATEQALDKVTSSSTQRGGFSYSTLAYITSQVRYEMGDVKGSVASLQEHFKLRDATDSRRSELIFSGLLAERQLETGHLDAACATWNRVLEDYPAVYSGRVDDRVRTAVKRLAPHLANATARHTHDRARALLAQRGTVRAV